MEEFEIKVLTESLLKDILSELILLDKQGFGEKAWDEEAYNYILPDKFKLSFIIEQKGEVIGFCINSLKEDYCYIHRIVVKRDFKRKGLGEEMIKYIEKQLRQKKIALKVNVNNIFAVNFYFKMNFKIVDVLNGYYTMKKHG